MPYGNSVQYNNYTKKKLNAKHAVKASRYWWKQYHSQTSFVRSRCPGAPQGGHSSMHSSKDVWKSVVAFSAISKSQFWHVFAFSVVLGNYVHILHIFAFAGVKAPMVKENFHHFLFKLIWSYKKSYGPLVVLGLSELHVSILLKEWICRFSVETKRTELSCVIWRYSLWYDNVNLIIV